MSTPTEIGKKDGVQEQLEEGPGRYAAYLLRIKTLIKTSSRYIAYSSDIGEAFRPLTRPEFVRSAYALSWVYIGGDCLYAGYKAHQAHQQTLLSSTSPLSTVSKAVADNDKALQNLTPAEKVELKKRDFDIANDPTLSAKHSEAVNVGLVIARRAVFQSIASMALPAFTIHSIVRYSAPVFAKSSNARIRGAGPTIAGLAFVPALPFLFDEPVEHVIDAAFDWAEAAYFGEEFRQKKHEEAKDHLEQAGASIKKSAEDVKDAALDLLPSRDPSPDSSTSSKSGSLLAKAAILGVGVDVLYLPRLRTMLHRQAQRMAAASKRRPACMGAADSIKRFALPSTVGAGLRLADRIGSEKERQQFRRVFVDRVNPDTMLSSQAIRWLALRWTAKEAGYKALFPHLQISWPDIEVSKIPEEEEGAEMLTRTGLFEEIRPRATPQPKEIDDASESTVSATTSSPERIGKKPVLSFSSAFAERWAKARAQEQEGGEEEGPETRKRIDLHLSISHDGDICTASVLAELVDADAPRIDAQHLRRTLRF